MDHVDEFRRSKNGGKELWGGLKWLKNGRKSQNSGEKKVQPPPGSPARSRRVKRWLALKFYGRHRPAVAHLLVWRVYSTPVGGASSGPISHGAQVATRPKWCSRFGEFSLRVLGAQVLFCG